MKSETKKELYSWGKTIGITLLIVILFRQFILAPIAVQGESMLSTFENNDKVFIGKLSAIERFDIVVFEAPDSDSEYIKRVIGVPGDSIQMKDDVLYINGKEYEEPYVNEKIDGTLYSKLTDDFELHNITGETTVPKGHYFVMGDNRWNSKDSRDFGFISEDSIIGEVKFQYYPLNDIGIPK